MLEIEGNVYKTRERQALLDFIKWNEVLSDGVDSTVVAALLHRAVGSAFS